MDVGIIIAAIVGLGIGVVGGRYMVLNVFKSQKDKAKNDADSILKEAEMKAKSIRKEKELEAQEALMKMRQEQDSEHNKRIKSLDQRENSIKQKDQSLSQKIENSTRKESELDSLKETLNRQLAIIDTKKDDIEKVRKESVVKLEKIAGLSAEEAKEQLMTSLKDEAKLKAMSSLKEIVENARNTANKEAKKIVIESIQRTATEHAIENAITVFNLKNDDVKGQIIGREGRNIRAFEAATGVEIVVDDTPEAIVISCFDPYRRELARLALHKLITDGRIHPARIEEVVAKTKKQLEEEIVEVGERTCIDLGLHGLHPELVRLVGRMKYRSSYGQNLLQHSREVANLCAIMAGELGLNAKLAKRAGLLHDIGKVSEENPELPHALLGMQIAERLNENPIVCNAIGAHHDEIEMTDPISAIVQACDSVSGARPGARREVVESYLKRLKDLENMAMSNDGVQKAYAIQAGRELRVIVESDKISDESADLMATNLSEKIQTEMQYPGQIKITVIREKRAVAIAK